MEAMVATYWPVAVILIFGIIIGISMQMVGVVVRPDRPNKLKVSPYECGIKSEGGTLNKNAVPYYIYGLLFLLFDVEVLFFFLWAVIYRDMMLFAFIEMTFFATILFLGLLYAWFKGALDWQPNRHWSGNLTYVEPE